jgi:parvulin-like peptidyl-prolyl isomerase
MAKTTKTPATTPPRPVSRRIGPKQQREQRRQRLVVIGTGVALVLALAALLVGVLYDQVFVPSQTVASVNDTNLSRRNYWQERRYALTREIIQSFQLDALLAGQDFGQGQDFTSRVPQVNQQIGQVRSLPLDDATLGAWQQRTLIEQGAQTLGVDASDGAIKQRLVNDLAQAFLPDDSAAPTSAPAGAPEASDALTDTNAVSPTTTAVPTPQPTPTPRPTITTDAAPNQAEAIITAAFNRYQANIQAEGQTVELTRDDFVAALDRQYREAVLTDLIQQELVPEEGFQPDSTPTEIRANHILCGLPEDVAEEQREAEYAQAKERCDAIYAQLQDGADFATLAREESDDEANKDNGGDLGFFGENSGFDPDFVQAAFALNDGEISEPVRTQFGYHIIQAVERRADPRDEQLDQARGEAFEQWLNEQRAAATLVPAPTPTPEPAPTLEPASEAPAPNEPAVSEPAVTTTVP